jgi:hypothetical protein
MDACGRRWTVLARSKRLLPWQFVPLVGFGTKGAKLTIGLAERLAKVCCITVAV